MKPSINVKSGLAVLAAAAFGAGCCGSGSDRRSALSPSPGTTRYYSSTPTTTTTSPTAQADAERTRVREATTSSAQTSTQPGAQTTGQNEYSLPLYSENLRVGKREVENGSVRLRKVVRTENASQPIELRRETVVIDREAFDQARRAADAGQASDFGAQFQEKEIVIDLKREEPVVEVEPFVSGRIIARKDSRTDQQTVQRQVRREEIEVVKSGNDQDITITERARNIRVQDVGAPGSGTEQKTGSSTETQGQEQQKQEQQQDQQKQQPDTQSAPENSGTTPPTEQP